MGYEPRTFSSPPAGPESDSLAAASRAIFGADTLDLAGRKWAALHEAAGVVAALAGDDAQPLSSEPQDFPAALRAVAPWRREAAGKAVDDLAAIMEPGIAALLAVNARGGDAHAPALALWREFRAARDALLALALPERV